VTRDSKDGRFSQSFKVGAIALICIIIGFQAALFVRHAAVSVVVAHRDRPDTVYVVDSAMAASLLGSGASETGSDARPEAGAKGGVTVRRDSPHTPRARALDRRRVESFRFNPNTVSVEDLERLGFSRRQAESIDNYRQKGGRYRRPSDFAKSYVVEDSVYERLKPFIDIPKIDINSADSAAFDGLPGIGPYFAARMVEMRGRLHGYSYPEQLMDIYNFDSTRFAALSDLITVGEAPPYPIWSLPEDSLALHPYIGRQCAHGVALYGQSTPPERRSALDLRTVLRPGMAEKLARCRLE